MGTPYIWSILEYCVLFEHGFRETYQYEVELTKEKLTGLDLYFFKDSKSTISKKCLYYHYHYYFLSCSIPIIINIVVVIVIDIYMIIHSPEGLKNVIKIP